MARDLRAAGVDRPDGPVVVQCFEPTHLRLLRERYGVRAQTALLTAAEGAPPDLARAGDERTYAELVTPEGLRWVRGLGVTGLGPNRQQVLPTRVDGGLGEVTSLVSDAHEAGLAVRPWTYRAENAFLPPALRDGDDPAAFGQAVREQAGAPAGRRRRSHHRPPRRRRRRPARVPHRQHPASGRLTPLAPLLADVPLPGHRESCRCPRGGRLGGRGSAGGDDLERLGEPAVAEAGRGGERAAPVPQHRVEARRRGATPG
ncbi:hypothetical protein GCM10025868_34340 [Angustibacter aerolatus]|uniref:GP-PDE domain-containing protein n=1 Tax=Angustibacter aerolatus TaxID=1162965 RepID=A0ABQ6JJX5_9ACTN|nr:hypothetical protein [Angustibacter aerolatus]GMA88184.1 hypothetical protein GCM10025868_34340 [Angustibacter aerolatus]